MRFGLTTPIVTLAARSHAPWEVDAGPSELRQIAIAADRLGYHHLTCSEHVGIPPDVVATRGGRYYDPLATFGYVAAVTERIRLATHVIVLPYHHPLEVAKRYGTLDRMSGGRLILGVGVGSLEPEFQMLGADFAGRGPVYEDALACLRAVLGKREPEYAGTHYRIAGFVIDPCAVQEHVPLWLGGRSPRSLRRALDFGDGWDPFRLGVEELGALLAKARDWPQWRARHEAGGSRPPFEVVLSPEEIFDVTQAAGRDAMRTLVRRYQTIGATILSLRFKSTSCAHFIEQVEVFMREIAPEIG
jgi:probable F420-dependent oxidoreductase